MRTRKQSQNHTLNTHWWRSLFLLPTLCLPALLVTTVDNPSSAATNQPTLNIFPTQVIDNIKETSEAAKALEDNLQGVVAELDQQLQLYKAGKCEGAPDDQGCRDINRQMARAYGKMLNIMADELPGIEQRVRLTQDALQARLATELGQNRSGAELQQLLRHDNSSLASSQRTRINRQGVRLSDRFRQYYKLVSQGSRGSTALIASQMYLDVSETSDLIALTRQEIQRSQVMTNLSESFGTITPEMEATVAGVKHMLFGDMASDSTAAAPADLGAFTPTGFCSELDPNC